MAVSSSFKVSFQVVRTRRKVGKNKNLYLSADRADRSFILFWIDNNEDTILKRGNLHRVCLCGQVARRQVSKVSLTSIKKPLDSIFKEEQT